MAPSREEVVTRRYHPAFQGLVSVPKSSRLRVPAHIPVRSAFLMVIAIVHLSRDEGCRNG